MDKEKILQSMTPEIYQRFRTAVSIRKWPDGRQLTQQQVETCMQAIIAYEHEYVAEHERTGYVAPKKKACATEHETPLKWQ
ncbi:YeaC family protein [Teredinibacter waterburyi]|uniref:YeaC family protein n=1 Tax=Teredinibacter waterburyi TaxID=1500538 RepID=UPI00165FF62E|nr:DUF1315 family protein [Teredinibacter waterburyi]